MITRTGHVIGVLALAALGASCGVFGPSDTSTVTIEGQVYRTCVNSSTTAGPCTNVDPVAGATVSTSLDSATATTDTSGQFNLVTKTGPAKDYGCKSYTLTITATGHPTYSLTGIWGSNPKGQVFTLSPPAPSVVGLGITPC
jgi:hypothetical protein